MELVNYTRVDMLVITKFQDCCLCCIVFDEEGISCQKRHCSFVIH
jgi:hypothetical protein